MCRNPDIGWAVSRFSGVLSLRRPCALVTRIPSSSHSLFFPCLLEPPSRAHSASPHPLFLTSKTAKKYNHTNMVRQFRIRAFYSPFAVPAAILAAFLCASLVVCLLSRWCFSGASEDTYTCAVSSNMVYLVGFPLSFGVCVPWSILEHPLASLSLSDFVCDGQQQEHVAHFATLRHRT